MVQQVATLGWWQEDVEVLAKACCSGFSHLCPVPTVLSDERKSVLQWAKSQLRLGALAVTCHHDHFHFLFGDHSRSLH